MIITEACSLNSNVSLIWYEDGLRDYMPAETCGVHPMIREAGLEYLFNRSESEIPKCKMACFYPELIPCSQEKIYGVFADKTYLKVKLNRPFPLLCFHLISFEKIMSVS